MPGPGAVICVQDLDGEQGQVHEPSYDLLVVSKIKH